MKSVSVCQKWAWFANRNTLLARHWFSQGMIICCWNVWKLGYGSVTFREAHKWYNSGQEACRNTLTCSLVTGRKGRGAEKSECLKTHTKNTSPSGQSQFCRISLNLKPFSSEQCPLRGTMTTILPWLKLWMFHKIWWKKWRGLVSSSVKKLKDKKASTVFLFWMWVDCAVGSSCDHWSAFCVMTIQFTLFVQTFDCNIFVFFCRCLGEKLRQYETEDYSNAEYDLYAMSVSYRKVPSPFWWLWLSLPQSFVNI